MIQNAGLSVGALLRSRREELGQDTESVSRQLRIRAIYLRAIEEGRIQDLPGSAYAVGFVRSYADFLGFDGNSVVASFRDELSQRGRPETVSWQIDDKDGGFPFGKFLVVLLVIAAAGYGAWYYLANTQSGSGLIEAVPEYLKKSTGMEKPAATEGQPGATPPAGTAAPASQATPSAQGQEGSGQAPQGQIPEGQPTPGQASSGQTGQDNAAGGAAPTSEAATNPTASSASTDQQGASGAQPGAAVPPAPGGTAPAPSSSPTVPQPTANGVAAQPVPGQPASSQTEPGQTAPGQTASGAAGSEAAPEVAAAASSPTTRISIHARLESWVQINDKDGKPVISRVLRAGETYAVPDEKGLVLNTGNAGGIDLAVDGKVLPSLGSVGLVKRNIALDADKLATGGVPVKAPAKPEGATDGAAPTGD